ncbi:MAG: cysteine synthase A [Spirochaetaceae bacterium]|nr:MAG: cysteine synthase A [Spirochaetaceae bacterium]
MPIHDDMTSVIGSTPLVRLNRISAGLPGTVLVKLETMNPTSSVKDRIGLGMVQAGERAGVIGPGSVLVEATSGNTGIALACVGAVRGYKVILTMPETMSVERRRLLQAFGAQLELTPGPEGMTGAVARAEEIVAENPRAVLMRQFANPANPLTHHQTTADEIWKDTNGTVDVFVAGVGTGGTITGVAGRIKTEWKPSLYSVAVEPGDSPVLSGGRPGPHRIQGIGAGFVPETLDRTVVDEVIQVTTDDAARTARRLAQEEGIFSGVSAGANVWAACELASRAEMQDKTIVTIICDTGERYLSTWLFEETATV